MPTHHIVLLTAVLGACACRGNSDTTTHATTDTIPAVVRTPALTPPACLAASTSGDSSVKPLLEVLLDTSAARLDSGGPSVRPSVRRTLPRELASNNAKSLRAIDGGPLGATAYWMRQGDSLYLEFGSVGRGVRAWLAPGPTGLAGWFVTHADFTTDSLVLKVRVIPCQPHTSLSG